MVEEVVQPRVSLKVRAGEKEGPLFQDVLVYDLSCRLSDFLDAALKDLEVGAALREAFLLSLLLMTHRGVR